MTARRQRLKTSQFHDLMPYRVVEVLLVSSPYDAFILEQDGRLTERVFLEYSELSLPASPRFTHVPSGEAALELLQSRHFDLVMTMTNLVDVDVNAFGRRVKELRPGRPVVLLALDRKRLLDLLPAVDPAAIDSAFLWSGDAKILLAVIKSVEDRVNVDHDIALGNVRVLIVVEDSPSYYSAFLGLLYKELMKQSRALYAEGVNELQRLLFMNSRPKVLHARTFEEATALLERYRRHLLAVISDMAFPRAGRLDRAAGLDFVHLARRRSDPALPVLLQSADAGHADDAARVGAGFVDKNSPRLLAEIGAFLEHELGFGDFVFRDGQGRELDRARDLRELVEKLAAVPTPSVYYHAARNHFSIWLMARSEFELAERIRPQKVSDFTSIESTRRHLIEVLGESYRETRRGVISDFSRRHFEDDLFSRLGRGSLGGKARGMAFLNMRLAGLGADELGGLAVRLPKTVVLATDLFDEFIERNALGDFAHTATDDDEIRRRFLAGRLPSRLEEDLEFILGRMTGPLAVRSSSLLEDSIRQPLAGIYATLMLPNDAPDLRDRARLAASALKLVYASTFLDNAKSYLGRTGNRVEEEKMAVIVQELVGRRRGQRFYPSFSGVAESYNFYPIGAQRAEDGVAQLALGLGRLVVDGGQALRFSPRHPGILPQLHRMKSFLDASQRAFYALDMTRTCHPGSLDLLETVRQYGLEVAEEDGTLAAVGSVFSPDDQLLREDLSLPGPRLVTFRNVLVHRAVPLADTLVRLLEIGQEGLGGPTEIEFAGHLGDGEPALYLLQIRPFARYGWTTDGALLRFARDDTFCAASHSLGHGVDASIRDLLYVRRQRWDASRNKRIAAEVGELNRKLAAEGRGYVLIGPGRWGTADEWLGIPVRWSQISNVKALVEASPAGYDVELSQGTHFFQNITSLRIGYLSLPAGAGDDGSADDYLDWRWLDGLPAHATTEHLRWLRFDEPLSMVLDGRSGRGVLARPGARPLPSGRALGDVDTA